MSGEEAVSFPAFSSERIRLLCKIVDVVVEAFNIAIELVSSGEHSDEEPDVQKHNEIGIINCRGKAFVIVARSYIEGRIRRSGIGLNRNTLRGVMKEFIDNKINGIDIVEGINDLTRFFVERCSGDKPNIIKKIRYKLRQQLGRLPSNTWFVIIDADKLRSSLESASVSKLIIQRMKEEQRYERLDALMKMLENEGINVIMLEDVLTMCTIIKLISSSTS